MRPLLALRALVLCISAGAVFATGSGGCQDSNDCPAKEQIKPGASCGSSDMQCAYDVPQTACDGTKSTVESSCFCTDGKWSCPDEWACETSDEDAGDETADSGDQDSPGETSDDGATTEDGGGDDTTIDDAADAADVADAGG